MIRRGFLVSLPDIVNIAMANSSSAYTFAILFWLLAKVYGLKLEFQSGQTKVSVHVEKIGYRKKQDTNEKTNEKSGRNE